MQKKDSTVCEDAESEEWRAKCYSSVIPETGNSLVNCGQINDPVLKNNCISQVALAKNSAEFCSAITDSVQQKFCMAGLGIANKDITACDSLPEGDGEKQKNACLYTYAQVNLDSRACEKISLNSPIKQNCQDVLNKVSTMQKDLRSNFLVTGSEKILGLIFGKQAKAQISNSTNIPVGGKFLAGVFDIYTFIPYCGLTVSVVGPRPGVFLWVPNKIYDHFFKTLSHVNLNTLGLARIAPPCVPHLFMLGSSLTAF